MENKDEKVTNNEAEKLENNNEVNEKQDKQKKKNNLGLIVLIIALLLVCIGTVLLITKSSSSDNKESGNNTENRENNNNTENDNNNEVVDDVITKEEAEEFLNKLSNLLFIDRYGEYAEQKIFYSCISYLVESNKYTKDGDRFVFNESDIKDLLRKYFMRESIEYKSEGMNVIYDQSSNTLSISIGITLARDTALDGGQVPSYSVEDFKYSSQFKMAYLKYNNYDVNLRKEDGELRITSFSPTIPEVKEKTDESLDLEEIKTTLINDITNNNYYAYIVYCTEVGNGETKNEYKEVSVNAINTIIEKLKSASKIEKTNPVGYIGNCSPKSVLFEVTSKKESLDGKKIIIMYSYKDNELDIGYEGNPFNFTFKNASEIDNLLENLS